MTIVAVAALGFHAVVVLRSPANPKPVRGAIKLGLRVNRPYPLVDLQGIQVEPAKVERPLFVIEPNQIDPAILKDAPIGIDDRMIRPGPASAPMTTLEPLADH